jgi:hypothetical protein
MPMWSIPSLKFRTWRILGGKGAEWIEVYIIRNGLAIGMLQLFE